MLTSVHEQLRQLRSQADPLEAVAKTIAERYEVCLLYTSDAADDANVV